MAAGKTRAQSSKCLAESVRAACNAIGSRLRFNINADMSEKMHLRCREQGRTEREEARAKEREEREAARAAEREEKERKRLEALAAKRYPIDDLELLQELSDRAVQCGVSFLACPA